MAGPFPGVSPAAGAREFLKMSTAADAKNNQCFVVAFSRVPISFMLRTQVFAKNNKDSLRDFNSKISFLS